MDAVFKALAEPLRRALLDRLLEQGGLSMTQLCEGHAISRFGVMKHVRVLEQAGLVVTRKSGRETLHYLNVVPIQQALGHWLGRFERPQTCRFASGPPRGMSQLGSGPALTPEQAIATSMLDLKSRLEAPPSRQTKPRQRRRAAP
jgi:DNA-binding transcriptional ArsR family regulator